MALEPNTRSRMIFVGVVAILLVLNSIVLLAAYPETMRPDGGCCSNRILAKDFSAFFTAAWRLLHDPAQVYTPGYVPDGEYLTPPQPESFKYLPSFLIFALPFATLSYPDALTTFNVFQFLLLPFVAYLVYELTKEKGIAWIVGGAVVVLLFPSPVNNWSLSIPYYWQWAEGQSKVLLTFLLLLSFYLGRLDKPQLSGIFFALSAFDPRFAVISIPLFLAYNRKNPSSSVIAAVITGACINSPLLDPPIGSGFVAMLFTSGIHTTFYYYTLIPLGAIALLYLVLAPDLVRTLRKMLARSPR